ncbi:RNA polymerase sigma factor [Dactylosporangium sp. NPDC005572]|uniref:RNA polymerase sigma factor n=1 Tax=Dactylosporangium sp. NPDC005572 TaxID=3156889 RepID=UPI0033BC2174
MQQSARLRVRAGDPEIFRELFAEYARSVYNHAFRLTGTWPAAEDVVSLTFLEAWRLRGTVDADIGAGSLRPWLLGIATNVARNLRRAARRHQDALARLPRPEPVPDLAEEVTARIDDRERLARVRVALAALRQPEREVLALCVWAGLDYAEAAEALGVPVGTVRSRLSRARARLARLVAAGKLREPPSGTGQMKDGRGTAALLAQEKAR